MEENHAEWLSHLSSDIVADAHGNLLDAYVIALEGWRRGLTLRWHVKDSEKFKDMATWFVERPGQLFSLSSKERTHYFFRTRGDKVSNEAVMIGKDKERTKQVLRTASISTPEGEKFLEHDSDEVIREYVKSIGYPVAIKPFDGSFGNGVITNITEDGKLNDAISYVRNELGYKEVLVERHVFGKEFRIYVVGDEAVGAINRIPPNVLGDGKSTIAELIQKKNSERAKNPRLVSCPIQVNEEIKRFLSYSGLDLDFIPVKDQLLYLSEKSNVSLGGDPIDILDELPEKILDIAVRAIKAIPGLNHGAVDVIWDENNEDSTGVVIEVNPTAQLGGILFPMVGKSRDVPSAIIDYYFPESKENKSLKPNLYFDLEEALEPLRKKIATCTRVASIKSGDYYCNKIVIHEQFKEKNLTAEIKKIAIEYGLYGYVKEINLDHLLEIVITGLDRKLINDFLCSLYNLGIDKTNILLSECDQPVKVGFYVQNSKEELIHKIHQSEKKLSNMVREKNKASKLYNDMLNSRLWKITRPVRQLSYLMKKIF
ncbi:hypothetical protein WKU33_12680 [Oceanobacillus sp. HCA-5259]|uniref:ATP-binding protein n=1 Tax=Oceanobacillus sp. HCA-5259 TaxID=3134661 RepID=UPI0030C2030E